MSKTWLDRAGETSREIRLVGPYDAGSQSKGSLVRMTFGISILFDGTRKLVDGAKANAFKQTLEGLLRQRRERWSILFSS